MEYVLPKIEIVKLVTSQLTRQFLKILDRFGGFFVDHGIWTSLLVINFTLLFCSSCVMEDDKEEDLYSFLSGHLKENCGRS